MTESMWSWTMSLGANQNIKKRLNETNAPKARSREGRQSCTSPLPTTLPNAIIWGLVDFKKKRCCTILVQLCDMFCGLEGIPGAPGSSRRPHGPKISKTFKKTFEFCTILAPLLGAFGNYFSKMFGSLFKCFFRRSLNALFADLGTVLATVWEAFCQHFRRR